MGSGIRRRGQPEDSRQHTLNWESPTKITGTWEQGCTRPVWRELGPSGKIHRSVGSFVEGALPSGPENPSGLWMLTAWVIVPR